MRPHQTMQELIRGLHQRATVGPQKRIVRPSLKNGTRFAFTQRWIVRGVTFNRGASSDMDSA